LRPDPAAGHLRATLARVPASPRTRLLEMPRSPCEDKKDPFFPPLLSTAMRLSSPRFATPLPHVPRAARVRMRARHARRLNATRITAIPLPPARRPA